MAHQHNLHTNCSSGRRLSERTVVWYCNDNYSISILDQLPTVTSGCYCENSKLRSRHH